MPPRTRREPPARQDARIRKHLLMAREYWSKAPQYLSEGDLKQASEKGWGAVAQLTKAVATLRGWDHYDHVAIREAVQALATERTERSEEIRRGLNAAESLHGNFYEGHLTMEHTEFNLSELVPLLNAAWQLIPAEFTGGASFDQWVAQGQ
ncbi:hypothetical protein GBAR_LOCUS734 [Geodia barretti]|uniref:Uncharacterized protein n=1 Tax=Geodia barretti TaxID=519541 RepID=A0AA35QTH7_GEOBA|nr:hypothetical protein GBAR_LOCUS734 [Geodia barretti]